MYVKIHHKKIRLAVSVLVLLLIFGMLAGCGQGAANETAADKEKFRIVKDMRGKEVKIPQEIQRVATISDGLVESTMISFGVIDRLVGIGNEVLGKNFKYEYETYKDDSFEYVDGMNPAAVVYPKIQEIPAFAKMGTAVNFESLASLNPDLVIVRVGDCTMQSENDENTKQAIERIEGMGLPVVVLRSPNCFEKPTLDVMYKEIELLGEVFSKEEKAKEIIKLWEENVQFVKSRTQDIEDQEKATVLFLGLNKKSREKGGAASVRGLEDAESSLVENFVNAKNAYRGSGQSNVMSAEQILALNPDVILLPTSSGYHPPRELYEGKPFRNLQDLKAIKDKRVYALPWTPRNCCIRLEHLVNLMVEAKAVYPEKFADLKVNEWVLDFYKKLYGVDDNMAKKIRSAQWLDWTVEQDF